MVLWICIGITYQLSSAMIYYRPQSDVRVKTFASRNSREPSLWNFECLDRLPNLFRDSGEKLWPFVFVMGFIFQQRASQYIINICWTSESKVMAVRILSDIRVKTFSCQNSPESSLLNSECLNRFSAWCGDPEERLWLFAISMGFILQ